MKNCHRKLHHYKPEENELTIILGNSLLNFALDNDGSIAELQQVLQWLKYCHEQPDNTLKKHLAHYQAY